MMLFKTVDKIRRVFADNYEMTLRQHTYAIYGCKSGNFQMKKLDIFLIFVQNKDCGYTLEPPQCFRANIRKQSIPL